MMHASILNQTLKDKIAAHADEADRLATAKFRYLYCAVDFKGRLWALRYVTSTWLEERPRWPLAIDIAWGIGLTPDNVFQTAVRHRACNDKTYSALSRMVHWGQRLKIRVEERWLDGDE